MTVQGVRPATGRFEGRCALVTGGANGIGAAVVRRLAAEGAHVVVVDIDVDASHVLAAEINSEIPQESGGGSTPFGADVGDEQAWHDLASRLADMGRAPATLVHNALHLVRAPAHQLSANDWKRQMSVTLEPVFLAMRVFFPALREQRGSVVNMASVHAEVGFPDHPAYAAAKGGMLALTRQLAVEYGPDIRVNAVVPGSILTRSWDWVSSEGREAAEAATSLNRLGEPAEVAAAVAFLASDDSSYITGTSLVVDGGLLTRGVMM